MKQKLWLKLARILMQQNCDHQCLEYLVLGGKVFHHQCSDLIAEQSHKTYESFQPSVIQNE